MSKPYYQDEWVTIYHGDCREILPELPLESVDLGITSPPFNLGDDHHTNSFRHTPYPDDMPEDEYQSSQIEILHQVYLIIKSDGSFFYQHKNRIKEGLQISPYQWLFKTPWLIKQEIVWENRSHNFDPIRFLPKTERIYWLAKAASTKLTNSLGLEDLWRIVPEGTEGRHKRAYPQELPEKIMSCFPNANVIQSLCVPILGASLLV